jgi:hypothetical protein
MFIDARSPEKLELERLWKSVGDLWDSLSPRERVIRFHVAFTPMTSKSWIELSTGEQNLVMLNAKHLHLAGYQTVERSSFSAAEKDKIETKK